MGWTCFYCKKEMGTFATHYDHQDFLNSDLNPPSGIGKDDKICQNCFNQLRRQQTEKQPGEIGPTSLLYLVPIFMGILGGILMYIAVKDENHKMANNGMIVGVIITIISIIVYAVLLSVGMTSLANLV